MEQATKERQTTTARTFKTRINLPADRREKLIALLNQQLADTFDLFGQTKQAHWNVKGPQFYQLHLLFDDLADKVEKYIDEIAERATTLGGSAQGTVRMAAAASRLTSRPPPAKAPPAIPSLLQMRLQEPEVHVESP